MPIDFEDEKLKRSPHATMAVQCTFCGHEWQAVAPADPWPAQLDCPVCTDYETRMVTLRRNCDAVPTVWCDPEIADLVDALNDVGLRTIASCSGHGHRPGVITMADHRHLLILSKAEFDALNELFPVDINGDLRRAALSANTQGGAEDG